MIPKKILKKMCESLGFGYPTNNSPFLLAVNGVRVYSKLLYINIINMLVVKSCEWNEAKNCFFVKLSSNVVKKTVLGNVSNSRTVWLKSDDDFDVEQKLDFTLNDLLNKHGFELTESKYIRTSTEVDEETGEEKEIETEFTSYWLNHVG